MRTFRSAPALIRGAAALAACLGLAGTATAETFTYEATFTECQSNCNSFAALGAPPSNNPVPSSVTGTIEINVAPGSSFVAGDIVGFNFEVFTAGAPTEMAMFDGGGNLLNPTTANPLPLDSSVAAIEGSGTTNATGLINSGTITFVFIQAPFDDNGGIVDIDIASGDGEVTILNRLFAIGKFSGGFALPPPEIDVAPVNVVFADTATGSSMTADVTVSNVSGGPLTVTGVNANGSLAAPFAIDAETCTGAAVIAGSDCAVTVSFTPAAVGPFNSSFRITSDDQDEGTVTVMVSGNATPPAAPVLAINPVSNILPTIVAGGVASGTTTISNTGNADLVIGLLGQVEALDPPYTIVGDTCSNATLAPMATCQLMVQCSPMNPGNYMDVIDIPSNDPDAPTRFADFECTALLGAEPNIGVAPDPIVFDETNILASTMVDVTLRSTGSDPLTISAVTINGPDAADFSQTNDCAAALDPLSTCTVTITFAPVIGGAKSANLNVVSDAVDFPSLDVAIEASAFDGPRISVLTGDSLQVGSIASPVEIGMMANGTVEVQNVGTSDLAVTAVTLGGANPEVFSTATDCTAATVPAAGTCTITVTYTPLTAGDKTATLTIDSDDADTPAYVVNLTGITFAGSRAGFSVPEFVISTSANPVDVGQAISAILDLLSNGTDDLVVLGLSLSGSHPGDFSFTEDCTAAPVPRGSACSITVTFSPANVGDRSAILEITYSDGVVTIELKGVAEAPPPVAVIPPGSQTVEPPSFALADEDSRGGCFIATAAYGSYLDPKVRVLRAFRDNVLMPTRAGRAMVNFYYRNSPPLADYIGQNDALRGVVRVMLTPIAYALAYPLQALLVLVVGWAGLRRFRGTGPLTVQ